LFFDNLCDKAHRFTGTASLVASNSFTVLDGNGNRTNVTQTEPLSIPHDPTITEYGYNPKKTGS